jgi:hypothetical protein
MHLPVCETALIMLLTTAPSATYRLHFLLDHLLDFLGRHFWQPLHHRAPGSRSATAQCRHPLAPTRRSTAMCWPPGSATTPHRGIAAEVPRQCHRIRAGDRRGVARRRSRRGSRPRRIGSEVQRKRSAPPVSAPPPTSWSRRARPATATAAATASARSRPNCGAPSPKSRAYVTEAWQYPHLVERDYLKSARASNLPAAQQCGSPQPR